MGARSAAPLSPFHHRLDYVPGCCARVSKYGGLNVVSGISYRRLFLMALRVPDVTALAAFPLWLAHRGVAASLLCCAPLDMNAQCSTVHMCLTDNHLT